MFVYWESRGNRGKLDRKSEDSFFFFSIKVFYLSFSIKSLYFFFSGSGAQEAIPQGVQMVRILFSILSISTEFNKISLLKIILIKNLNSFHCSQFLNSTAKSKAQLIAYIRQIIMLFLGLAETK